MSACLHLKGVVPMDISEVYNNTYNATLSLIINSYYAQSNCQIEVQDMAKAKELCTVKVCGPRQSGHTSVINQLICDFNDKFVIISYNHDLKKSFQSNKVFTLNQINKIRGFDDIIGVVIDTTSLFSQSQIDDIYRYFLPYTNIKTPFFYIFME